MTSSKLNGPCPNCGEEGHGGTIWTDASGKAGGECYTDRLVSLTPKQETEIAERAAELGMPVEDLRDAVLGERALVNFETRIAGIARAQSEAIGFEPPAGTDEEVATAYIDRLAENDRQAPYAEGSFGREMLDTLAPFFGEPETTANEDGTFTYVWRRAEPVECPDGYERERNVCLPVEDETEDEPYFNDTTYPHIRETPTDTPPPTHRVECSVDCPTGSLHFERLDGVCWCIPIPTRPGTVFLPSDDDAPVVWVYENHQAFLSDVTIVRRMHENYAQSEKARLAAEMRDEDRIANMSGWRVLFVEIPVDIVRIAGTLCRLARAAVRERYRQYGKH